MLNAGKLGYQPINCIMYRFIFCQIYAQPTSYDPRLKDIKLVYEEIEGEPYLRLLIKPHYKGLSNIFDLQFISKLTIGCSNAYLLF